MALKPFTILDIHHARAWSPLLSRSDGFETLSSTERCEQIAVSPLLSRSDGFEKGLSKTRTNKRFPQAFASAPEFGRKITIARLRTPRPPLQRSLCARQFAPCVRR